MQGKLQTVILLARNIRVSFKVGFDLLDNLFYSIARSIVHCVYHRIPDNHVWNP